MADQWRILRSTRHASRHHCNTMGTHFGKIFGNNQNSRKRMENNTAGYVRDCDTSASHVLFLPDRRHVGRKHSEPRPIGQGSPSAVLVGLLRPSYDGPNAFRFNSPISSTVKTAKPQPLAAQQQRNAFGRLSAIAALQMQA